MPNDLLVYRAYGLIVGSSFEIPELDRDCSDSSRHVDLRVRLSPAPFEAPQQSSASSTIPPDVVVLADPRFSFRITRGELIEVYEADAGEREIMRAYLVGIVFAVALYQRGTWPLHVSAVSNGSGAWLFGGRGGSGKSTMAAWLHARFGLPLVSDDAGVAVFQGSGVFFQSASRAVRLLPDALPYTFGPATGEESLVQPISPVDRKLRVRLQSTVPSELLPVRALVMLEYTKSGESSEIVQLRGSEALEAVRTSIFRPWLGQYMCTASDMLHFCAEFHSRTKIYAYRREKNFRDIDNQSEPLLELIAS